MVERFTVITRKGQITLPAAMRKALDLQQGDRVAVSLEAEGLRIRPTKGVVEATAGALKSDQPVRSAEELREAFEKGVAEDVIQRLGQ
ncbi:MAG: AbrB/MazE/SpoVT family DNA-binding domain-containing protein [Chloroflexi bacterium]|nr:AbrB/MazE/SpoVT family DNA-binding domain-containing protein [Chloroflexota bacterium]